MRARALRPCTSRPPTCPQSVSTRAVDLLLPTWIALLRQPLHAADAASLIAARPHPPLTAAMLWQGALLGRWQCAAHHSPAPARARRSRPPARARPPVVSIARLVTRPHLLAVLFDAPTDQPLPTTDLSDRPTAPPTDGTAGRPVDRHTDRPVNQPND